MASTNKTTNYELSQFLGTDKPAWLSDYNGDMNKIDTQMKANADGVTAASGASSANTTAIGTLANLTTTAKTDLVSAINEVDSNADTAQGTATGAATVANAAKTTADNIAASFNLTATHHSYTDAVRVSGATATISSGEYYIAKSSNGSICKIYGNLNIDASASAGSCTIKLVTDSGLRPDSDFQVAGCAEVFDVDTNLQYVRFATYTFKTTGEIDVTFTKTAKYASIRMYGCLIIVDDLGDNPIE